MKKFFSTFCLLIIFLNSRSQDYSYKHFTTKDGLAGNKVYQILQDRNRNLWFATESGVSRYDGTRFKNFTVEDGLPDNDIIKIFEDSRGRIWMLPFANKLCYFYKGRIYSSENDSILKKLDIKTFVNEIIEDAKGNIYFSESKDNLMVMTRNKMVINYHDKKARYYSRLGLLRNEVVVFSNTYDSAAGFYKIILNNNKINFSVIDNNNRFLIDKPNYCFVNDNFRIWNECHDSAIKSTEFKILLDEKKSRKLKIPLGFNNFSEAHDDYIFINTQQGSYRYDIRNFKYTDTFCLNGNISFAIRDFEGDLWFSSLNDGVFKLVTEGVQNIFNTVNHNKVFSFTGICGIKDKVYAGASNGEIYSISYGAKKIKHNFFARTKNECDTKIKELYGKLWAFNEIKIYRFKQKSVYPVNIKYTTTYSIKDLAYDGINNYYLATNVRMLGLNFNSGKVSNCFLDRCSNVSVYDTGIYIGDNKGLYKINRLKQIAFLGKQAYLLNDKINCLYNSKYLYVGTNTKGLLGFDGKNILFKVNKSNGLSSNMVQSIFSQKDILWVGTDKGLNKIDISKGAFHVVKKYSTKDGLSGNQIKAVYVYDSIIYVVTENGLSVIDEKKISDYSSCHLNSPDVLINSVKQTDNNKAYLLKANDNIQFDFVAISFKSEGEIYYTYKIKGLDDKWSSTSLNSLYFRALPSGKYEFQLFATNRFGVKSRMASIYFEVEKRFYQTYWFIVFLASLIFFLAWIVFTLNQKRKSRRINEKNIIDEKIAELKQSALKAQMNPHFIFNALNSIQHFIIDKNLERANDFISSFASLIRAVLENSTKKYITISEELFFLENYLNLEKLRFDNSFDYMIEVQDNIEKEEMLIPPMLIQPFVENSIIHGIRHRKSTGGLIKIGVTYDENILRFTITDNGVGRSVSARYYANASNNHNSKGIENVKTRIDLLNREKESDIKLTIEDLSVDNNNTGTKVSITISDSCNI